ncbi:hypothetical protein C0J52_26187 [Blattella germanica]|nr:hypothetical protein C0J52_26187 [Blattella germanica]
MDLVRSTSTKVSSNRISSELMSHCPTMSQSVIMNVIKLLGQHLNIPTSTKVMEEFDAVSEKHIEYIGGALFG